MRFSLRSANSVRLLWVKKIQPGFNCGAVFDGDDKSTEKICALCTEKLRVRGRLSGIEPTSKIVGLLLPIGAVKVLADAPSGVGSAHLKRQIERGERADVVCNVAAERPDGGRGRDAAAAQEREMAALRQIEGESADVGRQRLEHEPPHDAKAQPALGKGDKAGVVHGRERGTGGDAHVLRDGEGDAAPMARSFAVSWKLQKPDTTSTVIPGCRARKLLRMPGIQLMQVLEQVPSFTRPEESPVRPRTTSANA